MESEVITVILTQNPLVLYLFNNFSYWDGGKMGIKKITFFEKHIIWSLNKWQMEPFTVMIKCFKDIIQCFSKQLSVMCHIMGNLKQSI